MSGFIERVLEDWLTNASERGYQLPFAAYLARRGHTIKYISSHSSLEHGKDIVSVTGRTTHAYQLKAGSIDANLWRGIEGEVREVSTIPIEIPGMVVKIPDRACLVLSGNVTDPVKNKLSLINADLASRRYAPIELIQLPELVSGFASIFDDFCPGEIKPLHDLVRLYLQDGRGPQDKDLLFSVLDEVAGRPASTHDVARSVSNVVVAAEFAAAAFRRSDNHVSVIDTWVLVACVILHISTRTRSRPRNWQSGIALTRQAITDAGNKLIDEVFTREDFSEAPHFADTAFVGFRKLIALGYSGAIINARRITGEDVPNDSTRLLNIVQREQPLSLWGESSWNYELNIALALRRTVEGCRVGERLVEEWLRAACPSPSVASMLRDPYWSVSDAVSLSKHQEEQLRGEYDRVRISYTAESAVSYLARRMLRRTLARLWPAISRFNFASVRPEEPSAELDWRVANGRLELAVQPYTQSWAQLRRRAFEQRSTLLRGESWLLPYFLCTYDHRTSAALSGELDFLTSGNSFQQEWSEHS